MCTLEVFGSPDSHGNVVVRCPLGTHADNNPSGSFNVNTGLFFCFSCKEGLNRKQLERIVGKISLDTIKKPVGRFVRNRQVADLWSETYFRAPDRPGKRVYEYLGERNTDDIWYLSSAYRLRYQNDSIMFPNLTPSGVLKGYQERIIGPRGVKRKYMIHGDAPALWPTHQVYNAANWDRVYLTEGVFGAMRLRQLGLIAFAVMGTKLNNIYNVTSTLMGISGIYSTTEDIVCVFDRDKPGQRAAIEYMKRGCSALLPGCEADELPTYDTTTLAMLKNNPITIRQLKQSEHGHKLLLFEDPWWRDG